MPEANPRKVAIIGGGASGMISARILQDCGFAVTLYEQGSHLGGLWHYNENPEQGVMYQSLRTNLPKEIMIFRRQAVSYEGDASFVGHQAVRDYLEGNARQWRLASLTRFNTRVTAVRATDIDPRHFVLPPATPISPEALSNIPAAPASTRWEVSAQTAAGATSVETYDFVAICNGHFSHAIFPELPGHPPEQLHISHSARYRHPRGFEGRVLCVGYASSGVDITRELADHGCSVFVAKRETTRAQEQWTLQLANSTQAAFKGFISPPRAITRQHGREGILTAYGNFLALDHLLWCSGYAFDFPFLQAGLIHNSGKWVHPLWQQLFHCFYPSLAFVGLPQRILPFPLFETQARTLAAVWAGEAALPDQYQRLRQMYQYYHFMHHKLELPERDTHVLAERQWHYHRELLKLAGCYHNSDASFLNLVQAVYDDNQRARSIDPVHYRRRRYHIDWQQQTWQVTR